MKSVIRYPLIIATLFFSGLFHGSAPMYSPSSASVFCSSRCLPRAGTSSAVSPAILHSATPSFTGLELRSGDCDGAVEIVIRGRTVVWRGVRGGFRATSGLPVLRLRGHYFAIATLALGQVMTAIVSNLEIAGRNIGLVLPILKNDVLFYELSLMVLVAVTSP